MFPRRLNAPHPEPREARVEGRTDIKQLLAALFLQPEIGIERDSGKNLHVVVLPALRVLHEDWAAVAVAALGRRVGAEVDLAGHHALVVANARERIADRRAVLG